MDSHGRRFYGVDERSYEREMNKFFSDPPSSETVSHREGNGQRSPRGGNKKTVTVSATGAMTSIFKILSTAFLMFTIFALVKNIIDEMAAAGGSSNGEEGDVFDKMFGSEFSSKFKGARLNEGIYQRRREERTLRNSKIESNTTPPSEIRLMIPSPEQRLVGHLRDLKQIPAEPELRRGKIREVSRCPQSTELFRILYRGYTYRELLSEKISKWDYLSEASGYILECFRA